MRSRTGCLTCRHRKLKCDELKPSCGQCRKASRECLPSSGIVFRHQQNASMNGGDGGTRSDGNLKGFYAYKNTFDEGSVWLDIPKQVTFVANFDPCAEPSSPELDDNTASTGQTASESSHDVIWGISENFQRSTGVMATHGLEALSAAASADSYPQSRHSGSAQRDLNQPTVAWTASEIHRARRPPTSRGSEMPTSTSPPASLLSSNNNLDFILNPSSTLSPPIDPDLQPHLDNISRSVSTGAVGSRQLPTDFHFEASVETDHEIAFLLRHFAEAPGQWMDLFDLGTYFASYVPVKALSNPLLKYAACAYAAKQLGRVNGRKTAIGGACSRQADMELWPDADKVDWSWIGANYYDKAISLLMEALQQDAGCTPLNSPRIRDQLQAVEVGLGDGFERAKRRRLSGTGSSSDELLAATAILCGHEFLDASGAAWSRHLSGTKSLLDIAEVGMIPLQLTPNMNSLPSPQRLKPSVARKATFWNFARQDFLAAFINECQTRLDPENLQMWKDAGLLLDDAGNVLPSNNTDNGYPESDGLMKEDMISNALVWLMSKLVNYIAAGDGFSPIPAGHRSDKVQVEKTCHIGVSQQTLLERWREIQNQIDIWFNGLPATFKACARVKPRRNGPQSDGAGCDAVFSEVWYSISMCASTMQHYHMARILLLINKPHESTARRSTVANRLQSYRSIEAEIRYHSHEICGIALSRPEGSVRIHQLQPLFVAGQCLTEPRERRIILSILRSIEADLGWATEYRVQQLLKEWD